MIDFIIPFYLIEQFELILLTNFISD